VSFFAAQGTVMTTVVLLVHSRGLGVGRLGDQATASLAMGTLVLLSAAVGARAGRIGDLRQAHAVLGAAGLLLQGAGLLVMARARSSPALLGAMGLVGIGVGTMSPSLLALVGRFVPVEQRGSAVGVLQLFADIGGALGPLAGAALFARSTAAPFVASALLVVCALPLTLRLRHAERSAASASEAALGAADPWADGDL
jgi:sugar phosphate permease